MTLEEKATNYCNEMMCTICSNIRCGYKGKCAEWETRKTAYLAGVKENGIKWHDLQKDPSDLPNDSRVVSDQEGNNVKYVAHLDKWFYRHITCKANVIAWCEKPTFDKE